ncbi:winged helix-turn-helix domain-containing protein [Vibrio paucivorans]
MDDIRFSNLKVDCTSRALHNMRGDTVVLRPLPFQVLMLLYENRGKPVSRDMLFSQCWDGSYVTDQALTNVISGIRSCLDKLQAVGVEVKTITKVGYLLDIPADKADTSLSEDSEKPKQPLRSKPNSNLATKLTFPLRTWTASKWTTLVLCAAITLLATKLLMTSQSTFLEDVQFKELQVDETSILVSDNYGLISDYDNFRDKLKSQLPADCKMNVYLRVYESIYNVDEPAMQVFLQQKLGHKNSTVSLFSLNQDSIEASLANIIRQEAQLCE